MDGWQKWFGKQGSGAQKVVGNNGRHIDGHRHVALPLLLHPCMDGWGAASEG
jgi:hypothetical protein